jgi:hypothetical protein
MVRDLQRDRFLAIDRLPDEPRQKAYERIQKGELHIEQLHTLEDEHPIIIPGGLIHHWVAVIFIPRATLSEALEVLQDYDNQQKIYAPLVQRSKLLERNGNQFRIHLQYCEKSILTAVLNVDSDVSYERLGSTRLQSAARSTRVTEVENLGKSNERELPVGDDHGFLWRFNSYWRVEEKDGGVYIQNESVALTRKVPLIITWLVNPLLNNIPRSILSKLLFGTLEALEKRQSPNDRSIGAIVTSNSPIPSRFEIAGDKRISQHLSKRECLVRSDLYGFYRIESILSVYYYRIANVANLSPIVTTSAQ